MNTIQKKEKVLNSILSTTAGFTLMETLVTIFIFGLIITGTTLILKNILVNGKQQTLALNNIDQARRIANTFENELRNSTYGINGAYPISEASDNQLIFFSTIPLGDGTISRVRYFISNGILYKGITNPSGSTYNTTTEKVSELLNTVALGNNPLFYYYDGNYDGSTNPLIQQVNINNVKFIKINLVVLKQTDQNSTSTFIVNGGTTIRNLKNNLGN